MHYRILVRLTKSITKYSLNIEVKTKMVAQAIFLPSLSLQILDTEDIVLPITR